MVPFHLGGLLFTTRDDFKKGEVDVKKEEQNSQKKRYGVLRAESGGRSLITKGRPSAACHCRKCQKGVADVSMKDPLHDY